MIINLEDQKENTLNKNMGIFKNKKQEVNQINNKELKEQLLDSALAFLVNANEIKPKDFKGIQAIFGYLLMLENYGIEALFKIIKDDKIFYFAFQQNTLRFLDISEQQFESVTQHMLDLHVNNA